MQMYVLRRSIYVLRRTICRGIKVDKKVTSYTQSYEHTHTQTRTPISKANIFLKIFMTYLHVHTCTNKKNLYIKSSYVGSHKK